MTLTEHIARRAERLAAAERAAIGRPAVWASVPAPIVRSPFVVRALAAQLPAKDLGR